MNKLSLMTRIRRQWNKTLKGRAGQSTTEYILILAIVVMIASKLKTQLLTKVQSGLDTVDFSKFKED